MLNPENILQDFKLNPVPFPVVDLTGEEPKDTVEKFFIPKRTQYPHHLRPQKPVSVPPPIGNNTAKISVDGMAQPTTDYRSQIMQIGQDIMVLYANLGKEPEPDFCCLPKDETHFTPNLHATYLRKRMQLNDEWEAISDDLDAFMMDLDSNLEDTSSDSERDRASTTEFVHSIHEIGDADEFRWSKNGKEYALFTEQEMHDTSQRVSLEYDAKRAAFRQFRKERRKEIMTRKPTPNELQNVSRS